MRLTRICGPSYRRNTPRLDALSPQLQASHGRCRLDRRPARRRQPIASSSADLQSQIQANKSAAASLQGQINSETRADREDSRRRRRRQAEALDRADRPEPAHHRAARGADAADGGARSPARARNQAAHRLHRPGGEPARRVRERLTEPGRRDPQRARLLEPAGAGQLHQGRPAPGRADRQLHEDRSCRGPAAGDAPRQAWSSRTAA